MGREYDKTHYRKLRQKLLALDNTCYYCGQEATTIDHIIPLSKGGITSEDNCVSACNRCNSGKRDRIGPGAFLPHRQPPKTPLGNFIPENGSSRVHYA